MAEDRPTVDRSIAEAATVTLLGYIIKMLIAEGLLNEENVVSKIEEIAADFMSLPSGPKAVGFLQIVQDIIEGNPGGLPS
jgi:hypothetical protein